MGLQMFICRHLWYHITQSIVLALLLSFYAVRVFVTPETQISGECKDVNWKIHKTFGVCFAVHIVEFVNSAFIGPYYHLICTLN